MSYVLTFYNHIEAYIYIYVQLYIRMIRYSSYCINIIQHIESLIDHRAVDVPAVDPVTRHGTRALGFFDAAHVQRFSMCFNHQVRKPILWDHWGNPTGGALIPGWWFGCHEFDVPRNIGLLIIPIDELKFFRGVACPHQPAKDRGCSLLPADSSLMPATLEDNGGYPKLSIPFWICTMMHHDSHK